MVDYLRFLLQSMSEINYYILIISIKKYKLCVPEINSGKRKLITLQIYKKIFYLILPNCNLELNNNKNGCPVIAHKKEITFRYPL